MTILRMTLVREAAPVPDDVTVLAGSQPCASGVAILLSTHNGAPFLAAQLHSLLAQTHRDWMLYWRDDGSSDSTRAVVTSFAAGLPAERSAMLNNNGRVGSTESFMRLLRTASAAGHIAVAFADQDDVWLPEKLARALAALKQVPDGVPALYCGRQVLVDAGLRRIAISFAVRRPPGFPAALTQNIATGCTVMLNRAAATLIARSEPPAATMHDWWCYLVVAAAGGQVLADNEPVVLYRQHYRNVVGAPATQFRRALRALRRGPGAFMRIFRQHVAALRDQADLLAPVAGAQVAALDRALDGGLLGRLAALRMPGLIRQSWPETMLFRLWFLLG